MEHPGMKARDGYRWVRRHGAWREERNLSDEQLAAMLCALTTNDVESWCDDPNGAVFDLTATYADVYDGPEALCDCCGQPLETVGALVSGRCSACVVARREPTEESRAVALAYAQSGDE